MPCLAKVRALHFLLICVGCLLQRLVSFTRYEGSDVRRVGAMGAIRNCCFDYEVQDLRGP